jgi:hypothetical protein
MTTLEQRLHEALLAGAAPVEPAPDLFGRVMMSVADDRRRRRLIWRGAAAVMSLLGSMLSAAVGLSEFREGRWLMPWWVLELVMTLVLIGLALWLGPFIKRFGRAYAADVFRSNPRTGKSFIVLADIVYYLIFTAYIMFVVRFEPEEGWAATVTADQLTATVARIGGILLIIGVLHGLNIVMMPFLGQLFSLNRRLGRENPEDVGKDGESA